MTIFSCQSICIPNRASRVAVLYPRGRCSRHDAPFALVYCGTTPWPAVYLAVEVGMARTIGYQLLVSLSRCLMRTPT